MALQKTLTLPNTMSGNYIKIGNLKWDDIAREAIAEFFVYANAAARQSAPKMPLFLCARLRLQDEKFDQYFSTAALAAAAAAHPGDPIRAQFYAAAKTEHLRAGGGLLQSDIPLADAIDV